MTRSPRPVDEPILTRPRWTAIALSSATMAVGALAVFTFAPGEHVGAGTASVAGTMGFATFVLFQFFNILNVRSDSASVFSRDTFANRALWLSLAAVLALQVIVTHVHPAQRLFDTVDLTLGQWLACVAVASSIVVVEEVRKVFVRSRRTAGNNNTDNNKETTR